MSYLSRRMREDGWPKRKVLHGVGPDDLVVTITADTSRLDAALGRMSRVFKDLAGRAGLQMDPWQEHHMIELLDAGPVERRRR